jgi:hypothetical protein
MWQRHACPCGHNKVATAAEAALQTQAATCWRSLNWSAACMSGSRDKLGLPSMSWSVLCAECSSSLPGWQTPASAPPAVCAGAVAAVLSTVSSGKQPHHLSAGVRSLACVQTDRAAASCCHHPLRRLLSCSLPAKSAPRPQHSLHQQQLSPPPNVQRWRMQAVRRWHSRLRVAPAVPTSTLGTGHAAGGSLQIFTKSKWGSCVCRP